MSARRGAGSPLAELRHLTATEGPCAAGCGAFVPNRYGLRSRMLCYECGERLAAWRATPAASRGLLVYGKLVDGQYVLPA